jgi:choline dehydrogenase-like flavoprotein
MPPYLWEAARRAYRVMAQLQFAAGARQVLSVHEAAAPVASLDDAREAIDRLPMRRLAARLVSAHVMGGCAMGPDPRASVVDENGRHHQLANLSVHDASLFPTSVGANPQLSIYAQAARLSSALATLLTA